MFSLFSLFPGSDSHGYAALHYTRNAWESPLVLRSLPWRSSLAIAGTPCSLTLILPTSVKLLIVVAMVSWPLVNGFPLFQT